MEFSLVCLIYIVGVVAAAPAVTKEGTGISETEPSKIVTNEAYTHPKLHLFETQNYTIDKVLDVLKQEHEREHPVDTSSKKNGRTKRYTCSYTTLYGGSGGGYFDDGCPHGIKRINIHYQHHTIRGIQLTYTRESGGAYNSAQHGRAAGTHYQVNLSPGEEIVAVVGRYTSSRVQQLAFLTQHPTNSYIRHTFGPYGNAQGSLFIENRGNIVAVYGRKGADLDAVGFKYR